MGEKEKVTIMVLNVDLQCHKCYKKVKKVLCKFPQIRDQIYDEKQNQVVIKVVCCSPEKIRDKICCKGGGAIISIEIKEPPKPPPEEKLKEPEKSKTAEKPKDAEKSKPPAEPTKPCLPPMQLIPYVPVFPLPVRACCMDCYQGHAGGPCHSGHGGGPALPQPVPCVPRYRPPVRACCTECSQGHAGGPCHSGYGGGLAPYIQYDGYYGRPVYDSYDGGSKQYCVTRPDYFSEENASACRVM